MRRSFLLVALLAVFATFGTLVEMGNDGPILFDVAWLSAMQALRTDDLTRVIRIVTDVGGAPLMVPLSIALFVLAWKRRSRRTAAFIAGALAGSAILNEALKNLFARPRPSVVERVYEPYGLSFPSGHSQASMAFACTVVLVAWRMKVSTKRYALGVFLLPLIVGWTRTYLGVHYPTDVIGGWVLGAFWVVLLDAWYVRVDPSVPGPRPSRSTGDDDRRD